MSLSSAPLFAGSWVLVGGSRALPAAWAPVAAAVVAAVAAAGAGLSVGCSAGADELALRAGLARPALPLRVAAVGSASGAGFWPGSAPLAVLRSAGSAVSWCAGGPVSMPLRARLFRRSLAALAGCSSAVFLAPGAGSLAVAGEAVAAGVSVFALVEAGAPCPEAPRGCSGSWAPAALPGLVLPAGAAVVAWRWSPAQEQPPLF